MAIVLDMNDAGDKQRLSTAFELMTSRLPSDDELKILIDALNEQRSHYKQNKNEAQALLNYGEAPRKVDISPVEHAAYTIVINLIINLSEAITKS